MKRVNKDSYKLSFDGLELNSCYQEATALFSYLASVEGVSDASDYKRVGEALDAGQLSILLAAIISGCQQRAGISSSSRIWGEIVINLYENFLAHQPLEAALALDAYVADSPELEDQLARMCLLVEQAPELHATLTRELTTRLPSLGLAKGTAEFAQCYRQLFVYADYLEYFFQSQLPSELAKGREQS